MVRSQRRRRINNGRRRGGRSAVLVAPPGGTHAAPPPRRPDDVSVRPRRVSHPPPGPLWSLSCPPVAGSAAITALGPGHPAGTLDTWSQRTSPDAMRDRHDEALSMPAAVRALAGIMLG